LDESGEARDFFISYTQADRAWAEWIAWQLEAERYTTVLQAWDFRPGENFVVRMRDALQQANRTIAVLSPAYLASQYGTDEWTAAFLHDHSGQERLLPIRVQTCELPRLLATRIYIDLADVDRQTARSRLLDGVKQSRYRPAEEPRFPGGRARRTAARPKQGDEPWFPGQQPEISNLVARNPNFTGRDDLFSRLSEHLTAGSAVVVHAHAVYGLGGIGKTQLALEYAHRYQAHYDLIWWITAEQHLAIPGQLVALARRLGLPDAPEQAETIRSLWDELRRRDRWLLIFDDADQPADVRPYWPPGGRGQVLITSRNPAWSGLATPLAVDVLPREQSIAFLVRRIGGDQDLNTVGTLAQILGDLPLAMEQAAAYIEETAIPVGQYVRLFGQRAKELFALGRPSNSQDTIATIWTLSLERIRTASPAAEDLLTVCAFLAADDIPRDLLPDHAGVLPESLAAMAADPLVWQQTIGVLRRYSLITATEQTLSVHRLVQAVVRHDLALDQAGSWAVAGLALIEQAFPDQAYEFDYRPACAQLLPHAMAVIKHVAELAGDIDTTASLLNKLGLYLWGGGEYSQARPLLERAVAICEAHPGVDYPQIALGHNALGLVLHSEGNHTTARAHLDRAVAICEAHLGADHPDTARSLNDLANVLGAQGDLDGARALHERALAIREAHLGADHPDTARSLNNLATVLLSQGDLDGARALYQRALAIREVRLGPDHPNTAHSLSGLATVLRSQGDLDGARALHERALAIREAHLGADHPDTARSLNGLATVLRAQGDLDGARALYQRALAIREVRLGPDHPDTARGRELLAALENRQE
jgi:tetratricopeptide (TPR) repeat protein